MSNLRRVGQQPATSTDAFGVPVGAPQPTEHEAEDFISYSAQSREHRLWVREQAAASTPIAVQKSFHELAEEKRRADVDRWRAQDEQRREQIAAYEQSKRDHNARVLRERAQKKRLEEEEQVAKILIDGVFQQYGCSTEERRRVTQLVASRTPHLKNDPSAIEVKILQYRSTMGV